MKTKIYEIADHDVMDTFFGENPRTKAITDIAKDHGEFLWEGEVSNVPDVGDVLGLDNDEQIGTLTGDDGEEEAVYAQDEYVIVVRYYHADEDTWWLLVHPRHQVEVELS